MKAIKTITEEYLNGDVEKRLHLFLECPLLRDEFIQIEQGETLAQSTRFSQPAAYQVRGKKW